VNELPADFPCPQGGNDVGNHEIRSVIFKAYASSTELVERFR